MALLTFNFSEHESFDLYSVQSMSVDSLPKHISLPEHPGPTAVGQ